MPVDRLSALCERGVHDDCPHVTGVRQLPAPLVIELCRCTCHDRCRLTTARPATLQQFRDGCTCLGHARARRQGERYERAAELRNQRTLAVLSSIDVAAASTRRQLEAQLQASLTAAGVWLGPAARDLWVRGQWAQRGPSWLVQPKAWWAVLHSAGVGLRSLVRLARAAPAQPPLRTRAGMRRLPGGLETESSGLRLLVPATVVGLGAGIAAARTRGPARLFLAGAAALLASPVLILTFVGRVLDFLLRALAGKGEQHKGELQRLLDHVDDIDDTDDGPAPGRVDSDG